MVLVKRIRNRGANITVEAYGEVLFTPGGDFGRWTNRFSQRTRAFTAQIAPSNKRPRWAHYGKPLKSTFTASTTYQPNRLRVYSIVGSTSKHAYYVDQGTGVYAGNGPYPAKVLPPWTRGDPSLYEHTWHPAGLGRKIRPVLIKGQKGQFFMDAGVRRAFQAMRMRSFQVAADPKITAALASFPEGLANFVGNTEADAGFLAQLQEWRTWRDTAFNKGRILGRDGGYGSRESGRRSSARYARANAAAQRRAERNTYSRARRARESAERSRKYRQRQRETKDLNSAKPDRSAQAAQAKALRAERSRFLAAMLKKYGASNVERDSLEFRDGYYYVTVRTKDDQGRTVFREVRGKSTVSGN